MIPSSEIELPYKSFISEGHIKCSQVMNSYLGGAIDDFSKDDAKIPYVATVELSGTHKDGYVL